MELASNTVLVTGGASGIGLALAERFLRAGSEVIICGRHEDTLRAAQAAHRGLHTRVCDVETAPGRVSLFTWAAAAFPRLDVLVNNAGIRRRGPRLWEDQDGWEHVHQEIAVNFEAPVHLSQLFIPHLLKQPRAAIVNVTSGLGFAPMAAVPVYSATKAALHSFTVSLRHRLESTPIRVVEIIPPAVNTDLGGPGLHTFGVPVDEFADAIMDRIENGDLEVAYGFAQQASRASREELDQIVSRMNQSPRLTHQPKTRHGGACHSTTSAAGRAGTVSKASCAEQRRPSARRAAARTSNGCSQRSP